MWRRDDAAEARRTFALARRRNSALKKKKMLRIIAPTATMTTFERGASGAMQRRGWGPIRPATLETTQ
eukprot:3470872-Pyramimonas_sp.AAC.1